MAQPPSPHAITGSLSLPGNLPRSSGRKTTWPGEPKAGSDMTLYGPGIAFGAPSSGSVVPTRSFLIPGGWAKQTDADRRNAAVSADFMAVAYNQPAASCLPCAMMALRMNIATVTGPTPPGTGVTQLATSLTASVSTSPTIIDCPLSPMT